MTYLKRLSLILLAVCATCAVAYVFGLALLLVAKSFGIWGVVTAFIVAVCAIAAALPGHHCGLGGGR